MDAAWPGVAVEESNLLVQIAALRKLLGATLDGGDWIATVPRVGYRFAGSLSSASSPIEGVGAAESRPLIVVLPFGTIGEEPGKEYLADCITDDIITALTRYRWFRVVVRGLALAVRDKAVDLAEIARCSVHTTRSTAACDIRRSTCASRLSSLMRKTALICGRSGTISRWPMFSRSRMRSRNASSRPSNQSC
jgi:hypothetical protein